MSLLPDLREPDDAVSPVITNLPLDRRLAMNEEETHKIWQMGAERYMRDLRRRGRRLLAESDPGRLKTECIDERQEDGITNCLAGLGVHIPTQRPAIARNMIQKARTKYLAQRRRGIDRPIVIDLTWHGEGMCGAALKALKDEHANEPNRWFTRTEIDAKAQEGGNLLKEEIERQLRENGEEHIAVVHVSQVPTNRVLHADGHPGGVIVVNGDPRLEFNRTGQELLTYDTSYNVFGGLGVDDAVLAARIMMSGHGKAHVYPNRHGNHGHEHERLREEDKPLYVAMGSENIALQIKHSLETTLRRLPERDRERLHGRIDLVDSRVA